MLYGTDGSVLWEEVVSYTAFEFASVLEIIPVQMMLGWPSDLIPTLLLNDLVEFTINMNLNSIPAQWL